MKNLTQIEQDMSPLISEYQMEIPTEHPVICMVHRRTKELDCYALEYKGYYLSPKVYPLKESGYWELRVAITNNCDDVSKTRERIFSTTNTFPGIGDAVEEAIQFGQQIIDREFIGVCLH